METEKLAPTELKAALNQFTGTEHYYRHIGKLLLTDGTKFLADNAGCYWLYDIVWSVLPRLPEDSFAVVKLAVDLAKHRGVVVIEDGNDHGLYRQIIPFTDFPLAEITLYLEDTFLRPDDWAVKVLLLPGEH